MLASLASLSKVSYIGEVKLAQEDPDNKATTDVQLLVPARELEVAPNLEPHHLGKLSAIAQHGWPTFIFNKLGVCFDAF